MGLERLCTDPLTSPTTSSTGVGKHILKVAFNRTDASSEVASGRSLFSLFLFPFFFFFAALLKTRITHDIFHSLPTCISLFRPALEESLVLPYFLVPRAFA